MVLDSDWTEASASSTAGTATPRLATAKVSNNRLVIITDTAIFHASGDATQSFAFHGDGDFEAAGDLTVNGRTDLKGQRITLGSVSLAPIFKSAMTDSASPETMTMFTTGAAGSEDIAYLFAESDLANNLFTISGQDSPGTSITKSWGDHEVNSAA